MAEASVVAERDAQSLDKPVAYVVLRAGFDAGDALTGELRGFVRERLAVFKCPKTFHFVSELPKTATGKIQRFQLRRRAAAKCSDK